MVPVIALVGNDACWTQIAREQTLMLGAETATNLDYTAYNKVAEGYGAFGLEVAWCHPIRVRVREVAWCHRLLHWSLSWPPSSLVPAGRSNRQPKTYNLIKFEGSAAENVQFDEICSRRPPI